jgi:hypothetical protein
MPSELRAPLAGLIAALSACGESSPVGGDGAGAVDVVTMDVSVDAGADATDGGAATVCAGGRTTPCAGLGGSWSGGKARCRGDGSGWDVSGCALAGPGQPEMVKPAEREPSRFDQARCNDGTPFGFWVWLAPEPSPVWAVYLQGGVMCDDYAFSCATRLAQQPWRARSAGVGYRPATECSLRARSRTSHPDSHGSKAAA